MRKWPYEFVPFPEEGDTYVEMAEKTTTQKDRSEVLPDPETIKE